MSRDQVLQKLARVLAGLYTQKEESIRIVQDAGVSVALVPFAAVAADNWHAIVRQADRESKVDRLMDVALRDYPTDSDLAELRSRLPNAGAALERQSDNLAFSGDAPRVDALAQRFASLTRRRGVDIVELPSGEVRWSGDVAAADIGALWVGASDVDVAYHASLFRHEELSEALLRLSLHVRGGTMFVSEPHRWTEHLPRLLGDGLGTAWDHGGEPSGAIDIKDLKHSPAAAVPTVHSTVHSPPDLARQIHDGLDAWVLNDVNERIAPILRHGRTDDFPYPIDERLAADMWTVWCAWRNALDASADLRRHFLRIILTTALKDQSRSGHARMGPRTVRRCIARAIVFALAVTVGLPRDIRPAVGEYYENLTATLNGTGHLCGLELIDTVDLSVKIRDLIWRTDYVLLPHYDGPGEEIPDLSKNFSKNGSRSHRFDRPLVYSPLFFTNETAFRRALGDGADALHDYLAAIVTRWDRRQQNEVADATDRGPNVP